MPTTTNFGWTTPADTDLVKDGAAAIRTLGNGIDTSLVDLKGGTSGQVLSKASNTDMDFTWVAQDDSNAIQNAIVDAKGDLIAASANDTPARLAVGSNGETLVADSSATTGLRWQGDYAAGKNKIINGDFAINQRGFTSITTNDYTFDRWRSSASDGTNTYSAQTFTVGSAPVAGYEAINFMRVQSTGQTATSALTALAQRIEDVRTFAGQTVTVSFWAKASTGTPNIIAYASQGFGSGGSSAVNTGPTTPKQAITTSWARYSFVIPIPSISGKTIGANSQLVINLTQSAGTDRNAYTDSLGIQSVTIDYWGVQVEAGSVATAFQTATGTLAGELAACQRYYFRSAPNALYGPHCQGTGESTTTAILLLQVPTQLRITAASVDYSALRVSDTNAGQAVTALVLFDGGGLNAVCLRATVASGLTQYRPYLLTNNNNAAGYVAVSAEL